MEDLVMRKILVLASLVVLLIDSSVKEGRIVFGENTDDVVSESIASLQMDEAEYDVGQDLLAEYYFTLNQFYEPVYDDEFLSDAFIKWFSSSEAKEIKKSLDTLAEELKQVPDINIVGVLSLQQTPDMIMEFVERLSNGEEFPGADNSPLKIYYNMSKLQARQTVESLEE